MKAPPGRPGGRRPNGRSSIYEGADGWWHGRVSMGVKNDGSPDRRHVRGKTEAEVTKKVQRLERDRDAGNVAKAGRAPTVGEWITTYLDTIASRTLAPRTLDDYRSKARNWIIPGIGQHRLGRLTPDHLDHLYASMSAAGKAPSHQLKVHRIIARALEIAVRRGKVARNVAKLVDPPSVSETEIEALTEDEARRVLTAALSRRNGARWAVGLALGLRQGEALGLRWKYLDTDTGQVRIWWQLQRRKWQHGCQDPHACGAQHHKARPCPARCKRHARACPPPCPTDCARHASTCPKRKGGGLVFCEPKGKTKRIAQAPAEVLLLLETHEAAQRVERELARDMWQEHHLVFSNPDGTPIDPRDDWDDWKDLLKAAGVRDARVHDGRHTAATLMVEQGVHSRVLMEVLGWSDQRLATRYSHVTPAAARAAAEGMSRALWGQE